MVFMLRTALSRPGDIGILVVYPGPCGHAAGAYILFYWSSSQKKPGYLSRRHSGMWSNLVTPSANRMQASVLIYILTYYFGLYSFEGTQGSELVRSIFIPVLGRMQQLYPIESGKLFDAGFLLSQGLPSEVSLSSWSLSDCVFDGFIAK